MYGEGHIEVTEMAHRVVSKEEQRSLQARMTEAEMLGCLEEGNPIVPAITCCGRATRLYFITRKRGFRDEGAEAEAALRMSGPTRFCVCGVCRRVVYVL